MISRIKWLSFSIELFLAIPMLGNIAGDTIPYYLCLIAVWHACVLYISRSEREPVLGSLFGIIASFLNFFPVVRIVFHAITALILYIEIKNGPGTD
ncbi:hypothetical protein JOC86_004466 [Bacillus pakistanensis]|uniref:Uncharacterized protein n=1 Tax=Rossellomorea pakistanensis TaxID=992288 RepID=A0ABS2NK47_9BACI|nr:hypothetical protein [Bacillus pakistanensis]MBM7587891.1 hypothetical protein [Bacillus pakistanensis]